MPALHNLPRNDKVEAIRFLVSALTRQQGTDCLQSGASYEIWTLAADRAFAALAQPRDQ